MRLALLLCLALIQQSPHRSRPGASASSAQAQVQKPSATETKQSTGQEQPSEGLWQRTRTDPVAFYTFVLAIFTGLLAAVSTIQISFLIRADRTATKAAEAAQASVDAAKETAERQLRAYVGLERIDSVSGGTVSQPKRWDFVVKNSGQTPAYDVRQGVRYEVGAPSLTPVLPELPSLATGSQSVLNPGAELHLAAYAIIDAAEMRMLIDQSHVLYYYGAVTYLDAFGKRHRSSFKLFWRHGEEPPKACAEGNHAD